MICLPILHANFVDNASKNEGGAGETLPCFDANAFELLCLVHIVQIQIDEINFNDIARLWSNKVLRLKCFEPIRISELHKPHDI